MFRRSDAAGSPPLSPGFAREPSAAGLGFEDLATPASLIAVFLLMTVLMIAHVWTAR